MLECYELRIGYKILFFQFRNLHHKSAIKDKYKQWILVAHYDVQFRPLQCWISKMFNFPMQYFGNRTHWLECHELELLYDMKSQHILGNFLRSKYQFSVYVMKISKTRFYCGQCWICKIFQYNILVMEIIGTCMYCAHAITNCLISNQRLPH